MSQVVSRIWEPVRRKGAERYIQITILSFAASVSLTRLILELTDYPQLGNQTYHIAHVLYGGLALFVAGILPLMYANRWVFTWSSILSGAGVGLFIDEVGKFITRNNNYFFPAAAPIIYAFFLMTVMIYLRVRREPKLDARGELYMVLETLSEVLDHSLEADELEEMRTRLTGIKKKTENVNFIKLSDSLSEFVESDALVLIPESENFFDKVIDAWSSFEAKYLSVRRLKAFLIVSLFILGLPSAYRFMNFARVAGDPSLREAFLENIVSELPYGSNYSVMWIIIQIIMDGVTGLAFGLSALLLFIGRERWGVELGSVAIIVALVAVNLVLFYIEQFSTVFVAGFEYLVLQGLYYYQRKTQKNMPEVSTEMKPLRT
jgi:hypothetical protein